MPCVWRLETENGNGPYCLFQGGECDLHEFIGLPFSPQRCPEPKADFACYQLLRRWILFGDCMISPRDVRFGFSSLRQYLAWFFTQPARRNLSRLGVQLVRYEVDSHSVFWGEKQIAFDRLRARKIEYRNPARPYELVGRQLELF